MQALVNCEVFQCMNWPTMLSNNAGIDPLWSHPMQALAHYEVNQCKHWPFMKSSNACIGRLWCHPMQALRSIVDIEFSLISSSRKWSYLFIWCILSLNTYVIYFRQPPSSIKLDHNVWHNSKADIEDIFFSLTQHADHPPFSSG